MLTELPAPVVRYFTYALTPGQPMIRRARVRSRGDFLIRPGGPWSPFTATQTFTVSPPGYLWDATIRMQSLLPIRVRDSYLDGVGKVSARLFGIIPMAKQAGTFEVTVASLQRYLAEAIWFPTALLPGIVVWTPINDSTARATITDNGHSTWVAFHFDTQGAIVGASTERYRDVDGTAILTPWATRSWGYERVQGMMVPTEASGLPLTPAHSRRRGTAPMRNMGSHHNHPVSRHALLRAGHRAPTHKTSCVSLERSIRSQERMWYA